MSIRRLGFSIGTAMLCVAILTIFTGCVGFVGPGGGGAVIVGPPVVFGGDYDRGHDVHDYSHRGYESRHWH
jgi:hypothetical protein